jgi:hypothetical protein
MLKEPLRVLAPPGVKFKKMEQLPPFAARTKALVQPLLKKVKSAELVPPIATVPMVTATFVSFVTMIWGDEFVTPRATVPKSTLFGLTETPGVVPLPNREMVVWVFPFFPLSLWMEIEEFRKPVAVGLNVTLMTQVLVAGAAGTTEPFMQVVPLAIAKSPGFDGPLRTTVDMVRGPLPVFVIVTVCGALVVPWPWFPKLTEVVEGDI